MSGEKVRLPAHWSASEQDGTQAFADEPDELIPAGTYLLGRDDPEDYETQRVVLRVECAIDEAHDQLTIASALADALNDAARNWQADHLVADREPTWPSFVHPSTDSEVPDA